ncbi:hypothetical protein [Bacillus toyonensis]|uniref:hypothetical protein n=1 Tax=Bacillus toyonensis TaxID=155322 RepID=UPI002E1E0319|nr:hypothetical protein [Bacillus toyonensis]
MYQDIIDGFKNLNYVPTTEELERVKQTLKGIENKFSDPIFIQINNKIINKNPSVK